MPRKVGRPSGYTPKIGNEICRRISAGETLREVLRSDGMPTRAMVMRWLQHDGPQFEEFRVHYKKSREDLVEHWAEEIVEIADNSTNDWMARKMASGGGRSDVDGKLEQELVPNHEHVNRSRLRIDSRKWLMSKLLPKKYGDMLNVNQKTEHSVSGSAAELIDAICGSGKRIHDKPIEEE